MGYIPTFASLIYGCRTHYSLSLRSGYGKMEVFSIKKALARIDQGFFLNHQKFYDLIRLNALFFIVFSITKKQKNLLRRSLEYKGRRSLNYLLAFIYNLFIAIF